MTLDPDYTFTDVISEPTRTIQTETNPQGPLHIRRSNLRQRTMASSFTTIIQTPSLNIDTSALRSYRSGNLFSNDQCILTRAIFEYRQNTRPSRRIGKPAYSKKQANQNCRSTGVPLLCRPRPVPLDLQSATSLLLNLRHGHPSLPYPLNR